jgi:hypothetical protein
MSGVFSQLADALASGQIALSFAGRPDWRQCDLQLADGVPVDLIERGILRAAFVARVRRPVMDLLVCAGSDRGHGRSCDDQHAKQPYFRCHYVPLEEAFSFAVIIPTRRPRVTK